MYTDEELLQLSGLQHLCFCPRQCALIQLENIWNENYLTASGRMQHERVHNRNFLETRGELTVYRDLSLVSYTLGLVGKSDAVEFCSGVITPIEYKHGISKDDNCDRIQLCAQAICLEEMLECSILKGFLYYHRLRRREEVLFTDKLREETEKLAAEYHNLMQSGITPNANKTAKCRSCSLFNICLPESAGKGKSAKRYIYKHINII